MRINSKYSKSSMLLNILLIIFVVLCIIDLFDMLYHHHYHHHYGYTPMVVLIFYLIGKIREQTSQDCKSVFLSKPKYIELLSDKVVFGYYNPKHNFSYKYEDIEQLNMALHTTTLYYRREYRTTLDEIELTFTVAGGATLSIANTPLFHPYKVIYKIIDCSKKVQKFSYKLSGSEFDENVEDYLKKGCKQILNTKQEDICKYLSIIFFPMGLIGFYAYNDLIFLAFLVSSIIIDSLLILDKMNETKFGIKRKSSRFIGKIPCELIILIQVIILMYFLYNCNF